MISPKNKKKLLLTAIAVALFTGFFYGGYRIGLKQAMTTFPEPEEVWAKEDGVRVDAGTTPTVIRLSDGTWRMYYAVKEGIVSALSQDGVQWVKDEGIRLENELHNANQARVSGPAVFTLKDGGYRMLYEGSDAKQHTFVILSAVSTDGLAWQREKGARLTDSNRFGQSIAASPSVVRNVNGELFCYYGDGNTIKLATSADQGVTWRKRSVSGLPDATVDPTVIIMPDGVWRIYFAASQSFNRLLNSRILSARSTDGSNWSVESGTRIAAAKKATQVLDPDVTMVSLGKMRLYYVQLDKGVIDGTGANTPVLSIRSAILELR